jgi:hypothetical protein
MYESWNLPYTSIIYRSFTRTEFLCHFTHGYNLINVYLLLFRQIVIPFGYMELLFYEYHVQLYIQFKLI